MTQNTGLHKVTERTFQEEINTTMRRDRKKAIEGDPDLVSMPPGSNDQNHPSYDKKHYKSDYK